MLDRSERRPHQRPEHVQIRLGDEVVRRPYGRLPQLRGPVVLVRRNAADLHAAHRRTGAARLSAELHRDDAFLGDDQ
ncbi:hypothetical protein OG555_16875 [Kribbella sp. NBC_01484]|uniref:hypothetical protein n=1 Tax=Kribbella sp. NBC_01484 TaxID=2903579 RepID=UPI002E3745AB|nr:hypothetical protein [Kribbella sp. NBC_01484]